jgi:N-acetylglucosaminyldiphosphoundecaprenol N-acetyl-beta-D-mannosaminyltransferase
MRRKILGCPVDVLNMIETVELARQSMTHRNRLQHVALNVAKLVNTRSDPVLFDDVANSDLVGIDGMGIVLAARLLGVPVKERVTGVDLLNELLTVCANEGFRPYFLGAKRETLEICRRRALDKHPTLRFAGMRDGYFAPEQEAEIVSDIRDSGADCLFIGMPSPRKERFLAAHRDELNVPFIMGVGGSFDVLSGQIRRAPGFMQAMGLEWLYRIYQEPGRMWWRYAKTNTLFAGILTRALIEQEVRALFGLGAAAQANSTRPRR